jgi:outer membrane protein assembly factor BamB
MNGKLYTIVRAEPGTPREGERVVCLDAATGKDLWQNRFNVWLSDVPDTRVGWSSCVGDPETGNIYALGVCGFLQCLDGKTGKSLWSYPLHERFGFLSTYGGRTNFPVVFDDLVIVSAVIIGWGDMAKPSHRFLAFDKRTGEVVWFESTRLLPEDTTYSSPTICVLNGQRALVIGAGDGLIWAFQPRTGRAIFHFDLSRRGINSSPLVVGNRIFACHSEENIFGTAMGAVVAFDGSQTGDITESAELWRVEEVMAGRSSPIEIDGRLYVIDDRAKLFVFDANTGDSIGRRIPLGSAMHASPLYADGKIYVLTVSGQWAILQPDPRLGAKKLAAGRLLSGDEAQASPICADGRIYLQTSGRLYCLADASKAQGTIPAPQPSEEDDPRADQQPALLQIVPQELLLRPGDRQQFQARVFNQRGQMLRSVKPHYEVDAPAIVAADGFLDLPSNALDELATALTVRATWEGLSTVARVRVVPPLPWKFDFEDTPLTSPGKTGEPPLPWIGCRYRHVIRDVEGNRVMVKVTTIPKGTRSRGWFGQSDLHDYTIQADVMGRINEGLIPDIGVIAQGYTFVLLGVNQQLQIRSWDSQSRMANTIPFTWKPDEWYRIKFRAENGTNETHLRGKVWLRDQPEPKEWTIEAHDPSPQRSGSPGLFGNATPAEIYLDNIEVTANN